MATSRVNRVTAYQKEKEIDFSTSSDDPLAAWRISGIKGPVFEQWYFDSVADDGKSGIVFTLARDASYALLGQGHLRVELDVTFSDGTHFNHVDWMTEAVIEDAPAKDGESTKRAQVKGAWTAPSKAYRHIIAADGTKASVEMDTPQVSGHFTLAALSPPMYPGGETQDEVGDDEGRAASTELLPKIHLVQVIPTATFEADLVFQGRPLRFRGIGGHMHTWAAGSWFDTTLGWRVCRGVAGPWSVTCMEFWGTDGTVYSSGYVAKDGKKHFGGLEVYREPDPLPAVLSPATSTSNSSSISAKVNGMAKGKKRVRWYPVYNTGLAGRFNDKSTGAILHYSTGEPGEEYKFELKYTRSAFDVWFGSANYGLSAFLGEMSGGRVGEEVYKGVQFTDICRFPQGLVKVYFFICMILVKLSFGYINVLGINT
ncbi:hypothetical protein B0I37DRAFT_58835 [Chaetomium sp. MPI-CAGE-AT-0009]|nr:hypothetical protein B0I37DRAFT_58835 [Chaetomium sp. MPI-CAGE-AT-0009]